MRSGGTVGKGKVGLNRGCWRTQLTLFCLGCVCVRVRACVRACVCVRASVRV